MYLEMKNEKQSEFNKLPLFFAYGHDQLRRELDKRGATVKDIYSVDTGCFCLKKDKDIILEWLNKDHLEDIRKRMSEDGSFAEEAFFEEMSDHEYPINLQGDWEVASQFGDVEYDDAKTGEEYLAELGFGENVFKAWRRARKKVMKEA